MRLMLKAVSRLRFNPSPEDFERDQRGTGPGNFGGETDRICEWRTVPVQYGEMTKVQVKRVEYSAEKVESGSWRHPRLTSSVSLPNTELFTPRRTLSPPRTRDRADGLR